MDYCIAIDGRVHKIDYARKGAVEFNHYWWKFEKIPLVEFKEFLRLNRPWDIKMQQNFGWSRIFRKVVYVTCKYIEMKEITDSQFYGRLVFSLENKLFRIKEEDFYNEILSPENNIMRWRIKKELKRSVENRLKWQECGF